MSHVLSFLTALPVAGAVLAGLAGARARMIALAVSLIALAGSVWIWFSVGTVGRMVFVERSVWVPDLGIGYHLGVDGLGAMMLVLAALVTVISLFASRSVLRQPGLYFGLVLLLEAGLFGTFTALNFFHWFLYWELSLIPAFFLIRLWGGPRRGPAATQFFVYTMVGSVALLLSFLALFVATGGMDFLALAQLASTGELHRLVEAHLGHLEMLLACGVLLGFAVKVPLMPFHTWLPETYAEAPTAITILLTGAMSKMGVYGLIRIALPIFGRELFALRGELLTLAVLTVVAGAWAAVVQKDLKRIFAYSSINHLGYCLLALFAVLLPTAGDPARTLSASAALDGAILQIFNHGLTAATIFWFLCMLEERSKGALLLDDFGGLRKKVPVFCGLMGIALFSSLGLPGLNGFVSEFLIFRGVFPLAWQAATVAVLGLLITAAVILTVLQRVFSGPLRDRWSAMPDLTLTERVAVAPALVLMLLLGLVPQILLGVINPTVLHLIDGWRF